MNSPKGMQNKLVWIVAAATLAAGVPLLAYLLAGGPKTKGKTDKESVPVSPSEDLSSLAKESTLERNEVTVRLGELVFFEGVRVVKEAGAEEASCDSMTIRAGPLFEEKRSVLDEAIRQIFEAMPPNTTSLQTPRLHLVLSETGGDAGVIKMRGCISTERNAFKLSGAWKEGPADCSLELIYVRGSGHLFAKYDCPSGRLFPVSFLSPDLALRLNSLTLTSGSWLELKGVAVVDRESEKELFSVARLTFESKESVDRKLFSSGLALPLLAREPSWKLTLTNVESSLDSMHLAPPLEGFKNLPPLPLNAAKVEMTCADRISLTGIETKIAGFRLTAERADVDLLPVRKKIYIDKARLDDSKYGIEISAASGTVVQDEYRTLDIFVDGFQVHVSANPLIAASLAKLRQELGSRISSSLDITEMEHPRLTVPRSVPDFRLDMRNGSASIPLMPSLAVSDLSLSAVVRGGTVERAECAACVGKECADLDLKLGLGTGPTGHLNEILLRFSGTLAAGVMMKVAPKQVLGLNSPEADCSIKIGESGWKIEARCTASVHDLTLEHEKLAERPLTFPLIRVEGDISVDPSRQELRLDLSKAQMGDVFFRIAADLEHFRKLPKIKVVLDFPEQSCSALLKSVPAEFAGEHVDTRLRGSLWFRTLFEVDLKDIRNTMKLEVDGDLERCKVVRFPRKFNVEKLNLPDFVHHVVVNGNDLGVDVGPGTGDYVPLSEIPKFVQAAAYGTEDLAFFKHNGFKLSLIKRALILYLERGYFAYGGSTISQQLVKNLFLTRHKTLARKFQEALIVWDMERKLTKERIFELYLNCIEYGPKIWGITRAARVYFGKKPSELTPIEAAFIMGLKSDPAYGYLQFRRGRLNSHWRENLNRVLKRLLDMQAISRKEYEDAMADTLKFHTVGEITPAQPRIKQYRAAPEEQEEL